MAARRRPAALLAALALVPMLVLSPCASRAADGAPGLEERMLARVNLYRARHDLAPLRADARLARAALSHALDMAAADLFGHAGSDGDGFDRRVSRAGYGWRTVGENIAGGLASPEDTVDAWMQSEGHRRNILNPAFRDAGIGHAFRSDDGGRVRYGHYWTLVLAAERVSR